MKTFERGEPPGHGHEGDEVVEGKPRAKPKDEKAVSQLTKKVARSNSTRRASRVKQGLCRSDASTRIETAVSQLKYE